LSRGLFSSLAVPDKVRGAQVPKPMLIEARKPATLRQGATSHAPYPEGPNAVRLAPARERFETLSPQEVPPADCCPCAVSKPRRDRANQLLANASRRG